MGKFTGTVKFTADNLEEYQQAMDAVLTHPEFQLLGNDDNLKTIDIKLL